MLSQITGIFYILQSLTNSCLTYHVEKSQGLNLKKCVLKLSQQQNDGIVYYKLQTIFNLQVGVHRGLATCWDQSSPVHVQHPQPVVPGPHRDSQGSD